jgi:hypothetical protein
MFWLRGIRYVGSSIYELYEYGCSHPLITIVIVMSYFHMLKILTANNMAEIDLIIRDVVDIISN